MKIQLNNLSREERGGFSMLEAKMTLLRLEVRRNKLIKEKEESWRLKSRTI